MLEIIQHSNYSARLGEGCVWDDENQLLVYVDILSNAVIFMRFDTGPLFVKYFDCMVCWIRPTTESDIYIVGLQFKIILWNWKLDKVVDEIYCFPDFLHLGCRLNDSFVDQKGKLWFGIMEFQPEADSTTGRLCMFDPSAGVVRDLDEGYSVPNGPLVSDCCVFHNDTLRRVMYSFDLYHNEIQRNSRRVLHEFSPSFGFPDGMAFDSDGNIWVAMWGGGCVLHISSLTGKILEQINLPAKNITNICFGGDDYKEIFVTTASYDSNINDMTNGSVFEIIGCSARGVSENRYIL